MDTPDTPVDLQTELTALRRSILTMAAGVELRIGRAFGAMLDNDKEVAATVRAGDDEIDHMEVDIEAECLRVLALHQPVAGDLRFVLAVMRITTDLERAADLAKGIAKRVLDLADPGVEVPPPVREMAAAARTMFADAVSALSAGDAELSRRICRSDEQVDDLQKEVFAWVQSEIPRHVEQTRSIIDILTMARRIERIADLATNIAEDVVFLAEGAVIRHTEV